MSTHGKIRFRCPDCDKAVSVAKQHAGKRGKCPGCGRVIEIPDQNPEKLYRQAVELFKKEQFREAAAILEKTIELAPDSAAAHFFLGLAYSQIGGEFQGEDAIRPWAKKSVAALRRALDLARQFGGLDQKQVELARDAVVHFTRVMEKQQPSLSEDRRREIYADFIETRDSELLLGTDMAQEFQAASLDPLGGLGAMAQSLQRNSAKAEKTTIAKLTKEHCITEGQLLAIKQEGKEKNWPFKGV